MKVVATNRRWFETADGKRYRGGKSRDGAAQPFELSNDEIVRYAHMGVLFDAADDAEADDLDSLTTNANIDPADIWPTVFTDEQRASLETAGFTTPAAVRDATDDQLDAVPGIGMGTIAKLRESQTAEVVIR